MPEENQGENTGQNAAGQQADSAQVATGQDVASQSSAGEANQDKGPVPYDRFKEVNEAKNEAVKAQETAEQEAQQAKDQLAVAMANQPQAQQPQQKGLYQQILEQQGLQDEPYLTSEQTGNVLNLMVQTIAVGQTEQQFIASHPDFAKVVGTQGPLPNQFQAAPPLLRVLNRNPNLLAAIQSSPQRSILAYELAVNDPEYQAEKAKAAQTPEQQKAAEAEAAIKAAQQQASISNVPSGGGNLDKGAATAAMSDPEFRTYIEGIMAQAI